MKRKPTASARGVNPLYGGGRVKTGAAQKPDRGAAGQTCVPR